MNAAKPEAEFGCLVFLKVRLKNAHEQSYASFSCYTLACTARNSGPANYHTNILHAVAPRTVSLGILPGDDRTLGSGPKRLMCIKRETQQRQSFCMDNSAGPAKAYKDSV